MVYRIPIEDGSASPKAESGMMDSRQGSPSHNWGTNAPTDSTHFEILSEEANRSQEVP